MTGSMAWRPCHPCHLQKLLATRQAFPVNYLPYECISLVRNRINVTASVQSRTTSYVYEQIVTSYIAMSSAPVRHMPSLQASLIALCLAGCCYYEYHMDIASHAPPVSPPVCCCCMCTPHCPCKETANAGIITCMTVKGLAAVPLMSSSPLLLRSSCTDGGLRKMTVFTLNLICSSGS